MEAEFFVESLGLKLFSSISVDNLPSLVLSVVALMGNDWLSFSVFTSFNIKYLVVLDVDELFTSVLEDLPPL
jgi:hypothetical protein